MKSGDYLDYSVEFYRRYIKNFWLMVLTFHAPVTFIFFFMIDYGNLIDNLTNFADEGEMVFFKFFLMYLGLLIYNLYSATILHALSIASIKYSYEAYVNNNILTVKESLKYGFKKFLWYVLYLYVQNAIIGGVFYVFYFIFMIAGFFLMSYNLIVPFIVFLVIFVIAIILAAIYLHIRMYFVPHVIAIEGGNPLFALKQSWKLTKQKFFKVFWPVCFAGIFSSLGPNLVSSAIYLLPIKDSLTKRFASSIVMGFASFVYPFIFILSTFIYIQLKESKGLIELEKGIDELVRNEPDQLTLG